MGVKRRYVAGSTAATLITLFSMLTWASESEATAVTPLIRRIAAIMDGLSDSWLKISMSAVSSGRWSGPGSATLCSGSATALDVASPRTGSAVGADASVLRSEAASLS